MVSINPLFIFWIIGCSISSWSKGCVTWCQSYWTRWCSLTGRLIGSDILCLTCWSDKPWATLLHISSPWFINPVRWGFSCHSHSLSSSSSSSSSIFNCLSIYRVFYITLVLYQRRRKKLRTVLKKTRCRFKIVCTLQQILHVLLRLVEKVNWLQECDLRKNFVEGAVARLSFFSNKFY